MRAPRMRMRLSPREAIGLVQVMTPRGLVWRAGHLLRRRTGLLRRQFPPRSPADVRLAEFVAPGVASDPAAYRELRRRNGARFFFPPGAPPTPEQLERVTTPETRARTLAEAEGLARGRFPIFGHHTCDLGWPVDWLRDPLTGAAHEARTHWVDYPSFDPDRGDVKDVWEPSRFAAAFHLARAYALTRDDRHARVFWELFEGWCAQNPPHLGPHYKCGQEISIRLMGWVFALYALFDAPSTTDGRVAAMAGWIAVQAERVEGNIGFAIALNNNHALSEAAGLITAGLLFPELRGADRWVRRGVEVLEGSIRRQVYADGAFVQHSMTYHRVMLHDCLWAVRLLELNDHPLSVDVRERIHAAAEFLFQMLDPGTGRVPNHGASDGAHVLPLAGEDYLDHRPTVQAARYLERPRRTLERGPWDEALLWLFGLEALDAPRTAAEPVSRRFDAGGYYTIRAGASWALVRCHSYRDRPSHVDPLHVDLWHDGVNVLADGGTFRYYLPEDPDLEAYFADIRAHNTVEVDHRGPLRRVGRFLWLPLLRARIHHHGEHRFLGEHLGYARRGVVHRRTVEADESGGTWVITDELRGDGEHAVALRWRLADVPVEIDAPARDVVLQLPGGSARMKLEGPDALALDLVRGRATGEGAGSWASLYYAERTAVPTVVLAGTCRLPCTLTTTIRLPLEPRR